MYPKILEKVRECTRAGRLRFTLHALEEMDADDLLETDIENCILNGEIVTRQWDEEWAEYKYLIAGETLGNEVIEIVARFGHNETTVVVTAYRL